MDRGVWSSVLALAEAQHGVVSVGQALGRGVSVDAIDHRVERGLLARAHPGVVRVVGAAACTHQRAMAAVLWLGPTAAISHTTAAGLLRLDVSPSGPAPTGRSSLSGAANELTVHVAVPVASSRGRSARAIRLHRVAQLDAIDRVTVDGISTTSPTRTIIDCAALLDAEGVESMMASALRLRLTSFAFLERRLLALGPRRRGAVALRALLARGRPQALAESPLEVKLGRLLESAGVNGFVRQHPVVGANGARYRVDVAWPRLRVALEADGFFWHGDQLRWKYDRRRMAALEATGWRVVQVTWDDVVQRPAETLGRITRVLCEARLLHDAVVRSASA